MSHYKLIYFDARGRAEMIRLILAYTGVAWEEQRIPKADWPTFKKTMPFEQIPVLLVDGKPLAQSTAIARYLARVHGLAGFNDWEAARCDMLVDGFWDFFPNFRTWFFSKPEEKAQIWKDLKEKALPPFLDRYEGFLKQNGTGYYVGKGVTWADLVLAECCGFLEEKEAGLLKGHPLMQAHMKKIRDIPNIKQWVQTRPHTEF